MLDNTMAAFSEASVEKLTGLTSAQLRYWDRTGFFAPAYADEDRRTPFSRIYSFKAVVGLRTLGLLRRQHNLSPQHLRQVAERLSHLEDDLWTRTTLYVLNRRVIVHEPDGGRRREAVSGQDVLGIPLKRIMADTRRDAERLLRRPEADLGKVEQSRRVLGNTPVIAGTRIPTGAIKRFRDAGFTVEQIIAEYPDLTPTDVEAALHYETAGVAA
ncbi:MAG TPA: DUF433 domain-containing protein [Stellaceae bacterium]|nr:DUF433 domain-containing protein [Stellaceae bacterium]